MIYEVYKSRVLSMVNASHSCGENISVDFWCDGGKFYAEFSDGTIMIGYADSMKISVKFGKAGEP